MSVPLTSLFPKRRNRNRIQGRSGSPVRRARLGVESLDQRIVPAVYSSLADGVLTVEAEGRGNQDVQVFLWTESNGTKNTVVFDKKANEKSYFATSKITKIVMNGGNGDDKLQNDTHFPSTITGGKGDDTLIGGWGSDIFHATEGRDNYTGGAGQDVLYRNGFRGMFADAADRATDYDLTVGQVSDPDDPYQAFSTGELRAQGSITASLDPANSRRLILNGPSGAAVVLKSNWTHNTAGRSFDATNAIKMETMNGDVTLWPEAGGAKTQVKLYGSPVSDAANFDRISWAGQTVTNGKSPLQDLLNDVTEPLGVTLEIPNAKWGIGLGSVVQSIDDDAPLNVAVPYIYAGFDTGFSISSSNASISLPRSTSATFAYAPSEGTTYVGLNDSGFAVSPYGYLNYEPTNRPTGVKDPAIWGQVYVRGTIPLTSSVSVNGAIVLDLDYDNDGQSALLDAASLTDAFTAFASISGGSGLNKAANSALAALQDTAIGFKGTLNVGFKNVVTLELGSASAWYKPGQVAFAAESSNPFEGLGVLEKLNKTKFDIEGVCNWTVGSSASASWSLDATAATASFGGLSGSNLVLNAGSDSEDISASATYSVPVLGTMRASGRIGFDGSFLLEGSIVSSRHSENADTVVTTSISIGFEDNAFEFSGRFHAYGSYRNDVLGAVGFSVDLAMTVTVVAPGTVVKIGSTYVELDGGIYVSASGELRGWMNPFWAGVVDVSIGFAFDNSSFTLDLPLIGELTIEW